MSSQLIWLIFLLPVISFLIISFIVRPFISGQSRTAGYITIIALAGSFGLAVATAIATFSSANHELVVPNINWLDIGTLHVQIGLMVDSLTAIMVVTVTLVSLMVQIYSLGYMAHSVEEHDGTYTRYYAWMSLFTASMLGVVMSNSLLLIFVFWELVGLCSYLLIGFWFHRPSAADAAKKAFVITRFGDFGFLIALLLIFDKTGTFDIVALQNMAVNGILAGAALTWAAIGIFSGAVGKSAQFPLHTWLPDAMEGPTPVSALIHSATMVSAGVFLVARTFPLFASSPQAATTVAVIGAFTCFFAASMGLVSNDIKRVLAYSTVSQLGYMMLGLGAVAMAFSHGTEHDSLLIIKAGVAIGIFHLFNHAFFKALLFLGSGSVNHASGTFNMRLMGGLKKVMPWTYYTFVIASLSLSGIWPLSGFWSKDEILAVAQQNQPVLFALGLITVMMTAFYMFRAVFLTFHGDYKGGEPETGSHPHESPTVMIWPMVVLSVLAIFSGFWNLGGGFFRAMGETNATGPGFFGPLTHVMPWISLILAVLGILLAWAMYSRKVISEEKVGAMFKPIYTMLFRKYWLDELYENIIVRISLIGGVFAALQAIDTHVVDGAVNGTGSAISTDGEFMRKWQTGQLQYYGLFIGIGVVVIAVALFIFG